MEKRIAVKVYAKINIGLSVGRTREDGYHSIDSIFQSIDISDSIEIAVINADGEIAVEGEFDCETRETTVYKAAAALREFRGRREAINIRVEKGIPALSGLGGGSADAAGTLLALDKLYGYSTDLSSLAERGARIGSDVPFFFSGGAALVRGRGELVTPIAPRTDFAVVLVFPGFGISTGAAFAALDKSRRGGEDIVGGFFPTEAPSADPLKREAEYWTSPAEWKFSNDFTDAALSKYPIYSRIRETMDENGALYQSLTGSGSCWYGVYRSAEKAGAAAAAISRIERGGEVGKAVEKLSARVVKPLDTSIILSYN